MRRDHPARSISADGIKGGKANGSGWSAGGSSGGRGIGLTTHEPPYMIEGEGRLMEPGMCFSIEPGIYLPDRFGVRIEDIVTVTEDGGRRLNNTSHEMRIVA
jgi:Xaa-Pro aminopeptidase